MDVDGLAYTAIGTSDLERSLCLYRDALGMTVLADGSASGAAVEGLYGLPPGAAVRRVLLGQQDVRYGMVQLLDFGAASVGRVQDGGTVVDHGHVKTLDVFVEDHAAAAARLLAHGFHWHAEPRTYPAGDISATEGHIDAPDDVLLAILQIHGAPRAVFARATGMFSEVGASSQVVADLEASVRFFGEGCGFTVHYDAELTGPGVDSLVGLPDGTGLHMTIMAPDGHTTGKVGLIRYGPSAGGRSLAAQSWPPRCGLVAHAFLVRDVDAVCARLVGLGGDVRVAPEPVEFAPWGTPRVAAVATPEGLRVELVEAL
jgi:catechol 2,3-dioxygenase-like lactoylglutathione lyase family enzyme